MEIGEKPNSSGTYQKPLGSYCDRWDRLKKSMFLFKVAYGLLNEPVAQPIHGIPGCGEFLEYAYDLLLLQR